MHCFRFLFALGFLTAFVLTTSQVSADEQLERDLQKLLDADSDGKISDKEADQGVAKVGGRAAAKDDNGKKLRQALDKNQDGRVDRDEAQAAVAKQRAGSPAARGVDEVFSKFDSNRDDVLSEQEFRKVVKIVEELNPDFADKLVKIYRFMDRNQDRNVTRVEAMLIADFLSEMGGNKREQEPSVEDKILQHAEKTLRELDGDGDGRLSRREASKNRRLAKVFKMVDADGDDTLSIDEMFAFLKKAQAQSSDGAPK